MAHHEEVHQLNVTSLQEEGFPAKDSKRQKIQQYPITLGDVCDAQKPAKTQLLELCKQVNNFFLKGFLEGNFIPFLCEGSTVGLVPPWVIIQLRKYPEVFCVTQDKILFTSNLKTPQERSKALDQVLRDFKERGTFLPLTGWREECYEIKRIFSEPALFKIERSASPLFGMRKYGVQITGYVNHSLLGLSVWFQKRAATKPTWPNMMDNFVGGGITEGIDIIQTAIKEAAEEANVPPEIADNLKAVGTVSFFHESERGIHPNTEFVFDLELPEDFTPDNNDGEVSGWELVPVDQVVKVICSTTSFKITSSPVVVDWLIRHGIVTHHTEYDLPQIVELIHLPLHNFYN